MERKLYPDSAQALRDPVEVSQVVIQAVACSRGQIASDGLAKASILVACAHIEVCHKCCCLQKWQAVLSVAQIHRCGQEYHKEARC